MSFFRDYKRKKDKSKKHLHSVKIFLFSYTQICVQNGSDSNCCWASWSVFSHQVRLCCSYFSVVLTPHNLHKVGIRVHRPSGCLKLFFAINYEQTVWKIITFQSRSWNAWKKWTLSNTMCAEKLIKL